MNLLLIGKFLRFWGLLHAVDIHIHTAPIWNKNIRLNICSNAGIRKVKMFIYIFWQPLSSDEKRKQSDFSSFEKRNWSNQIIKYFLISLSYYNIQHNLHYKSRNSKLFDFVFRNHSKSTTVDWRNSHWYRSSQKVELKNHRFEAILLKINFKLET